MIILLTLDDSALDAILLVQDFEPNDEVLVATGFVVDTVVISLVLLREVDGLVDVVEDLIEEPTLLSLLDLAVEEVEAVLYPVELTVLLVLPVELVFILVKILVDVVIVGDREVVEVDLEALETVGVVEIVPVELKVRDVVTLLLVRIEDEAVILLVLERDSVVETMVVFFEDELLAVPVACDLVVKELEATVLVEDGMELVVMAVVVEDFEDDLVDVT